MTQRIFKKSNNQDMIDLFNILPDWVNYIIRDSDLFCVKNAIKLLNLVPEFKENKYYKIPVAKFGDAPIRSIILDIDFETDKPEEMIITRPRPEEI